MRDDLGEREAALELYARALAIKEKAYGPDHTSVADTLYNMALLHKAADDVESAKSLFSRCVQIYASSYGSDHSETLDAQRQVARLSATQD